MAVWVWWSHLTWSFTALRVGFGRDAEGSGGVAQSTLPHVSSVRNRLSRADGVHSQLHPCLILSPSRSFGHIVFPLWFEFQMSVFRNVVWEKNQFLIFKIQTVVSFKLLMCSQSG